MFFLSEGFLWTRSLAGQILVGMACLMACGQAGEPEAGSFRPVLRVAADPNNLPFSNDKLEGFENRIAELVARDLKAELRYVWRAQRRGFFRDTLKAGKADVVMGVPADFEMAVTTRPYYRSTYAFVSRKEDAVQVSSLDDPVLRKLRIGVQLVGDDGMNTPPAHALSELGLITNLVGFTLYGNYADPNPPARIVQAVARQEVDIAVVWGPLAGYFVKKQPVPLELRPVFPLPSSSWTMAFDICMGVRRGETKLRDQLNVILENERDSIRKILEEYGVPQPPKAGTARGS